MSRAKARPDYPAIERRTSACTALSVLSQAAHQAAAAVLMGDGPAKMTFRLDEIEDMVRKIRSMPGIRPGQ
jgi:hypothetical protein